jgi:hypothetical protein
MFDFLTFFSLYVVLGECVIILFCKLNNYSEKHLKYFTIGLIFRIVTTFFYYKYSLGHLADSIGYYSQASGHFNLKLFLSPGTTFLNNCCILIFPTLSIFENRYLMMFLPFSFFGFMGSLLFFSIIEHFYSNSKKTKEPFLLAFFLPNMVFWTSNIGKDSLLYFGLMLTIFALIKMRNLILQWVFIAIGGGIAYFIRPHIIIFLLISFLFGMFLERQKFSFRSLIFFTVALIVFLSLYRSIFAFAGISIIEREESDLNLVSQYYTEGYNKIVSSSQAANFGGASTGAKKVSPVFALFYLAAFLGSPFLWQSHKPFQLFSAVENLLYQFIIIYLCFHWRQLIEIKTIKFKYSWIMFISVTSIILGAAQSNFGLIVRQKCMILPCVFLLFAGIRGQNMVRIKVTKKPILS